MKNAIEVENLSKKYMIGEREKYLTLRDVAIKIAKAPINILSGKGFKKKDIFWALKDVNFTVKQGEVIGIIGRNGAGKSTLLKILSRITDPTHGIVRLNGRMSSLLEVGTGFHPELSGRDNIYLNGAILGMSKKEIDRKFDEIVEFSGVKRFLDTPVKRYSSGMQVRLAFSVAAHLEPDILIIDEVLAVGDADFQKKCLGKMDEVTKKDGRTILFVSHDMGAIRRICSRCILLDNGQIKMNGNTEEVVKEYLSGSLTQAGETPNIDEVEKRPGNKEWLIQEAKITNSRGIVSNSFYMGDDLLISLNIKNISSDNRPTIGLTLVREDGVRISNMIDVDSNYKASKNSKNISIRIPDNHLYPARYFISAWLGSSDGRDVYDHALNAIAFEVLNSGKYTTRQLPIGDGTVLLTPIWKDENN